MILHMASTTATLETPRRWRRLVSSDMLFTVFVVAMLWFGTHFPIHRYISPQRGLGYALGIIGGSMMLLLLLYPLRKRVRWLNFMGQMAVWFRVHMVLGVLGPLLVLYHANFSTGATNSNVALFCMLTVSGSGLFGRYFYAQIHNGLYGGRATLNELRSAAQRLQGEASSVQFLPDLVSQLERAEQRLLAIGQWPGLNLLSPVLSAVSGTLSKWRLHRYIRHELKAASRRSPTLAQHEQRLGRVARDYADRRLAAARRVGTLQAYERLFALWHVLHLPLFFMLIVAGIVHVIAVHVY
jgi:hypothetical protein